MEYRNLYREPALARAAHTQKASYLDILTEAADWNPTDYSVGLTRRARGLPLWYSLATHGTAAYTAAPVVSRVIARTGAILGVIPDDHADVDQRDVMPLLWRAPGESGGHGE